MNGYGVLTILLQVLLPAGAMTPRVRECVVLRIHSCTEKRAKDICIEFAELNRPLIPAQQLTAKWQADAIDMQDHLHSK